MTLDLRNYSEGILGKNMMNDVDNIHLQRKIFTIEDKIQFLIEKIYKLEEQIECIKSEQELVRLKIIMIPNPDDPAQYDD